MEHLDSIVTRFNKIEFLKEYLNVGGIALSDNKIKLFKDSSVVTATDYICIMNYFVNGKVEEADMSIPYRYYILELLANCDDKRLLNSYVEGSIYQINSEIEDIESRETTDDPIQNQAEVDQLMDLEAQLERFESYIPNSEMN